MEFLKISALNRLNVIKILSQNTLKVCAAHIELVQSLITYFLLSQILELLRRT